jgi:hypothetical protein
MIAIMPADDTDRTPLSTCMSLSPGARDGRSNRSVRCGCHHSFRLSKRGSKRRRKNSPPTPSATSAALANRAEPLALCSYAFSGTFYGVFNDAPRFVQIC